MKAIFTIAQNEIRIGIRNRWVLLASAILLVFALILVLLGSGPSGATKAGSLTVVVASLSTLTVYLVPLIALLLSYDAIAGEIERGTLQLTLATQISRAEVLLGKFAGHLFVLALAVTVGYGVAGAIAYFLGQGSDLDGLIHLVRLIATSIVLGATFLAVGYLASVSVRQTGTAAALALMIWLFAVVLYDLALLGGLLASADGFFAQELFPYLLLSNPADAFRIFNMAALEVSGEVTGLGGVGNSMPVPPALAIVSPIVWAAIALTAAALILRKVQP